LPASSRRTRAACARSRRAQKKSRTQKKEKNSRAKKNMSFASRSKGAGDAWRRFPMLSGCWKGFGPWPGLVYATGIFTAYMVASKLLKKDHGDHH
jgi:hypothetical protein